MAAPPPVFSDLFDDATKWDEPVPDYDALILLFGGVASTAHGAPALYDRAQTMSGLANLARRSPTLIAFCPADDNEYIYVGHLVSVYPNDPLHPLGFDSNVITLVGNDPIHGWTEAPGEASVKGKFAAHYTHENLQSIICIHGWTEGPGEAYVKGKVAALCTARKLESTVDASASLISHPSSSSQLHPNHIEV